MTKKMLSLDCMPLLLIICFGLGSQGWCVGCAGDDL